MKVRVLVEVFGSGGKARKLAETVVGSKTQKLYEAMGGDDVYDFVARDVLRNSVRAVKDGNGNSQKLTEASLSKPAIDDSGRQTGRTELDELLGLEIIEHMNKKEQSGVR